MSTVKHKLLKDQVREDITPVLHQYIADRQATAHAENRNYGQLWKVLGHLAEVGGKRLRPYMTMLAYQAYGGRDYQAMLPVAAAQEILHLSLLVHDDIIDRDFVRYGVSNVSGTYLSLYEELMPDLDHRTHLANSAALLAGDLALSGAYELILESQLSAEQKIVAAKYLSQSIFQVAGGELLDTESVMHPFAHVDPIKIAELKTSGYSFVGPLITGAALAGATQTELDSLTQYGIHLGIAFQIADDILGVFGDSDVTGKTNTGDISEGKRTLLMQRTFELASPEETETLMQLVGNDSLSDSQADEVRTIVKNSGAKADAEAIIDSYADRARQALSGMNITEDAMQELEDLIIMATKRQK